MSDEMEAMYAKIREVMDEARDAMDAWHEECERKNCISHQYDSYRHAMAVAEKKKSILREMAELEERLKA